MKSLFIGFVVLVSTLVQADSFITIDRYLIEVKLAEPLREINGGTCTYEMFFELYGRIPENPASIYKVREGEFEITDRLQLATNLNEQGESYDYEEAYHYAPIKDEPSHYYLELSCDLKGTQLDVSLIKSNHTQSNVVKSMVLNTSAKVEKSFEGPSFTGRNDLFTVAHTQKN